MKDVINEIVSNEIDSGNYDAQSVFGSVIVELFRNGNFIDGDKYEDVLTAIIDCVSKEKVKLQKQLDSFEGLKLFCSRLHRYDDCESIHDTLDDYLEECQSDTLQLRNKIEQVDSLLALLISFGKFLFRVPR